MPQVGIDIERNKGGSIITRTGSSSPAIRKAMLFLTISVCAVVSGCRDVATVWSAEARSPDGLWLASARTEQHGGPGNAGVETIVDLKRINDSNPPQHILGFFHDPNNQSPTINLTMKWVTPSHLEVTYNGRADLDFQAVKFGGVDISVRKIPGGTISAPAQ
jgi:hypothetical protein